MYEDKTRVETKEPSEVNLKQDIARVKAAFGALRKPQLDSVTYSGISEYGCDISTSGFYAVKIDQRAVSAVLLACGVPKDQLKDITITFRAAQLPDKNYWGDTIAGLQMNDESDDGKKRYYVEVYTSIPQSSTRKGNDLRQEMIRNKVQNFSLKKKVIAETLLEELRHVVQDALGYFERGSGSFRVKDEKEFAAIDYEHDANDFYTAIVSAFEKFISVELLNEVSDLVVTDVEQTLPRAMWQHIDTHRAVEVIYSDIPGQVLLDNLKFLETADESNLDKFISQVSLALKQRKIGYVEARILYTDLIGKLAQEGNRAFISKVEPLLSSIS